MSRSRSAGTVSVPFRAQLARDSDPVEWLFGGLVAAVGAAVRLEFLHRQRQDMSGGDPDPLQSHGVTPAQRHRASAVAEATPNGPHERSTDEAR